jgi:hypothetical protein
VEISKEKVLDLLIRTGRHDLLDRAKRELPDKIDLDKVDGELLVGLGLDRDSLVSQMGGSP